MQLRLLRSQSDHKGIFGGHKGVLFCLNYRLDVSPEERELIDHYKVAPLIVHEYKLGGRSSDGQDFTLEIRVGDLVNGGTVNLKDFGEIVEAERGVISGATNLKGLIAQMRKFEGEEVIEI